MGNLGKNIALAVAPVLALMVSAQGAPIRSAAALDVSKFSGATLGDKIVACAASLPATGGVCDARNEPSGGTIAGLTIATPNVTIWWPCGTINLTGTIQWYSTLTTLVGEAAQGCGGDGTSISFLSNYVSTTFIWNGASNIPAFRLVGLPYPNFSDFNIRAAAPLATGIQRETSSLTPGGAGQTSTQASFRRITIDGANQMTFGMRWCTGSGSTCGAGLTPAGVGGDVNNDGDYLESVNIFNYTNAAFSIEGTQAVNLLFFGSSINGGWTPGTSPAATATATIGGTCANTKTVTLTFTNSSFGVDSPNTVTYTCGGSETTTTIATGLAAAIVADATMGPSFNLSATSTGPVITFNGQGAINNATVVTPGGTSSATVTFSPVSGQLAGGIGGARGVTTSQGTVKGGDFSFYGALGGHHSIADFDLGGGGSRVSITDCDMEVSNRLLINYSTALVKIQGCRFATDGVNADGNIILNVVNYGAQTLSLIGNKFEGPGPPANPVLYSQSNGNAYAEGNSVEWSTLTKQCPGLFVGSWTTVNNVCYNPSNAVSQFPNNFTGSLSLSGNLSIPAWTTNGARYEQPGAILTDTSSSGTVAAAYSNLVGGDTVAASSATTYTNYYGSYFQAPTAGTNATFTHSYAVGADSIVTPALTASAVNATALTAGGLFSTTFGTPTIASGACGATTNGLLAAGSTNQSGKVEIGSASTTTCTISFSTTLASAPLGCRLTPANAAAAAWGTTVAYVSAVTTGHWVITGSALANANFYYECF